LKKSIAPNLQVDSNLRSINEDVFPSHKKIKNREWQMADTFSTLQISTHRFRCHASTNIMATKSSAATSASAIINPYSDAATQLRKEQRQLLYGASSQATNQASAAAMGIQSQRREGAIKKCKKRGTKLKTK
jgi:hypothetical protein